MAKATTKFTADLNEIQGQVEEDVEAILKMAKQVQEERPIVSTSLGRVAAKPADETSRRVAGRREQQGTEQQTHDIVRNITTRLTERTNELLTDAALRQRLKKIAPATRQDIIEVAVREWLQRHGYDAKSPGQ